MKCSIFCLVSFIVFVCVVSTAPAQDSVVTGPSTQIVLEEPESSCAELDVVGDDVAPPTDKVAASAYTSDSTLAEREAQAFFYVYNQIANSRDSYIVPLEISQFVDKVDPAARQKIYDKHSRVASIIPALVNFWPIPFLGTIILGDTFGGYLIGGAALLAFIAIPGAASQCAGCQLPASIMLYAAGGLAAWAAVRPFYLYQKNKEYNRALAAVLRPPDLTFISLKPVLQANMAAGVVVPAMQLAIGF
ncbi:MAG: hypothetical protein RLZZ273_1879 [Bacteroidota bacterium]|jgi:hypothetical protein